mgnify:CR=1 FL=1
MFGLTKISIDIGQGLTVHRSEANDNMYLDMVGRGVAGTGQGRILVLLHISHKCICMNTCMYKPGHLSI